jgi:hypothetical protein
MRRFHGYHSGTKHDMAVLLFVQPLMLLRIVGLIVTDPKRQTILYCQGSVVHRYERFEMAKYALVALPSRTSWIIHIHMRMPFFFQALSHFHDTLDT